MPTRFNSADLSIGFGSVGGPNPKRFVRVGMPSATPESDDDFMTAPRLVNSATIAWISRLVVGSVLLGPAPWKKLDIAAAPALESLGGFIGRQDVPRGATGRCYSHGLGPPGIRGTGISSVLAIPTRSQASIVAAMVLAGMLGCGQTPAEAVVACVRRLGGRAETIRRIDLAQTPTTDADLERLAAIGGGSLTAVEELDLTRTGITDRGLAAVRGFSGLTRLTLTLTAVTDEGLRQLEPLEHLADLALIETAIDDHAVEPLSRLTRLRRLVLMRTRLSDTAIARLRQMLPRTAIHVEPAAARARRNAR